MAHPVTPLRRVVACRIDSPLGAVVLAASVAARGASRLCGLWFDGQKHQPDDRLWEIDASHAVLIDAARALRDYWTDGKAFGGFDLPLDLSAGTAFQQQVWQALLRIPLGHTVSYAELARRIGRPTAVRAVAAAVGRNPISIIVPCHRVLGSDGRLTGYAGGTERKAALLALEGAR